MVWSEVCTLYVYVRAHKVDLLSDLRVSNFPFSSLAFFSFTFLFVVVHLPSYCRHVAEAANASWLVSYLAS